MAIPARRDATTFGVGLRDGAIGELLRGALFSLPFLAALVLVLATTGLVHVGWEPSGLAEAGGFSLHTAPLLHDLDGPAWVTGGPFGVEAGVIGIGFLVVMLVLSTVFARGRRGPWTVTRRSS